MSVLCGNTKAHGRTQVRHETVADVRACCLGKRPVKDEARLPVKDEPRLPLMESGIDGQIYIEVGGTLYAGVFTVVFADGSHRTLRISRQAKNAAFKPGQLLVSYLSGQDNERDYTTFGHVWEKDGKALRLYLWSKHRDSKEIVEAAKVLCMDPQAAAAAYAVASERCSAAGCHRLLTAPVEENPYRKFGLGPVCGAKILG